MRRYFKGGTSRADAGRCREVVLTRLLADAARARRPGVDRATATGFALRSLSLLEQTLTGPLPRTVDLAEYLTRVGTLHQMATPAVRTMMSSVASLRVPSRVARALAVALTDLVRFIEAAVPEGKGVTLYLVVAADEEQLVVGLAASGRVHPVATAVATGGLLRAAATMAALGGAFQRGVDAGRMVFGVTFGRA